MSFYLKGSLRMRGSVHSTCWKLIACHSTTRNPHKNCQTNTIQATSGSIFSLVTVSHWVRAEVKSHSSVFWWFCNSSLMILKIWAEVGGASGSVWPTFLSTVDVIAQTDAPLLIRTCLVAGAVSLNLSGYSLNVNYVCWRVVRGGFLSGLYPLQMLQLFPALFVYMMTSNPVN